MEVLQRVASLNDQGLLDQAAAVLDAALRQNEIDTACLKEAAQKQRIIRGGLA